MASTGLPVETVNLLVASAIHFVVYIDNTNSIRRVTSVREVVDSEGPTIVSNEIFHLDIEDGLVTGFPLREHTRKLLSAHGLGNNTTIDPMIEYAT
jgi:hypothetical protein